MVLSTMQLTRDTLEKPYSGKAQNVSTIQFSFSDPTF